MTDYYVLQTLKVAGRTHYILRGQVENAPSGTTVKAVTEALTAAGMAPSEAGIAWANHTVKAADKTPALDPGPDPWGITWAELLKAASRPATRQLNVRVPADLYRSCESAALTAGTSLRAWVQDALLAHAAASQPQE